MRRLRGFLKVALRALNGLGLDWRPSKVGRGWLLGGGCTGFCVSIWDVVASWV